MSQISVVIPCHDAEGFLDDAVRSVFDQTYNDWELVIVDDGSTDATGSIADTWTTRDGRISAVHQPHRGLSAARNAGLRASSGCFLQFLDADDLLLPQKLASQIEFFDRHPEVAVVFGRGESGSAFDCPPPRGDFVSELLTRNALLVNSALIRRQLFDDVGLFSVQSTCRYPVYGCEDWDLWLRAAVAGHAFAYRDDLVVENRSHDANMSRDTLRMKRSALWVLTEAQAFEKHLRFRDRLILRHQRLYRWCDYVTELLRAGQFDQARHECEATIEEAPRSAEAQVSRTLLKVAGKPIVGTFVREAWWKGARLLGRAHTIPERLVRPRPRERVWPGSRARRPPQGTRPKKGARLLVHPAGVAPDGSPATCWLAMPGEIDDLSLGTIAEGYVDVQVDRTVLGDGVSLPTHARVVEARHPRVEASGDEPRILFLLSNDTHAQFLAPVAERFPKSAFAVPDPREQNEKAAERLPDAKVILLDEHATARLRDLDADLVVCANDWSPEFRRVRRALRSADIPFVAVQEGPQEWDMKSERGRIRQYRNADILLAQGVGTLQHIRPLMFAITGNPKLDRIERLPLPSPPRVLVNCNFTYHRYEEHRCRWLNDVLWTLDDLGIDYLVSQHPRDRSTWKHPRLNPSNAFLVRQQLACCSLVVTRFSSLVYEGLALGRPVVYYNPHHEPMQNGFEPTQDALHIVERVGELRRILKAHQKEPRFSVEGARAFLRFHCGPMDGGAVDRIEHHLRALCRLEA